MKIVVSDTGFTLSGGLRTHSVKFAEIAGVTAVKIDKVTYDEVFLIIHNGSPKGVSLGELDEGFAEVEHQLRKRLPNFPEDWWENAEENEVGTQTQIWPRPA
jgi:hypothetical protein